MKNSDIPGVRTMELQPRSSSPIEPTLEAIREERDRLKSENAHLRQLLERAVDPLNRVVELMNEAIYGKRDG